MTPHKKESVIYTGPSDVVVARYSQAVTAHIARHAPRWNRYDVYSRPQASSNPPDTFPRLVGNKVVFISLATGRETNFSSETEANSSNTRSNWYEE